MRGRRRSFFALGCVLLFVALLASVSLGAYRIPWGGVLRIVGRGLAGLPQPGSATETMVVLGIRLPRALLALLVGAALSASGAVFQGLFRNPLVEPYVLGVSAGSAFGAALSIVLAFRLASLQLTSFLCGGIAMASAYFLAARRGEVPLVNLILAGMVIGALFTAGLSYLKMTAGARQLQELTFWLMGGFYAADWSDVLLLAPQVAAAILLLWTMSWRLNVLGMGDEEARSMGIAVRPVKLALVAAATYITSLSVSTVGIVSWVGLMIPHVTRMTIGPDNRALIPGSALLGALFMVLCDTLARVLTAGEIPISILTSVIGAPYLIYLIRTNRRVYFN